MAPKKRVVGYIKLQIPAGAATVTARPRTNSVLSKTERTITLAICGRLNGGSSSWNDDGIPFKMVFDKIFDTIKVMTILKIIKTYRN